MNIQIEQLSSVKKRISVEVPAEVVTTEIEKAWQQIGKTAKIKGFRPGKVPRPILEQHYAPQMEHQVINRLVSDSYMKALDEHTVAAVSDPKIVDNSLIERGKPFTFSAEVEVKPEVLARDYTGLQLKKERYTFDAKVIDERLEEMRQGRAEMQPSKRKTAATGDFVTIDFVGSIDGVPFDGGAANDHQLELGAGQFIPGFEEQVVGMKIGEARDVNVAFPENYGKSDLAGKPALFKVTLKGIQEKLAPALNDEFAKGFGLETMAELREKLTDSYNRQETSRVEGDLRERLVSALIERNPLEVPETMVQKQLTYMLGNIRRRLESQGMRLEMMGITEESFRTMYRETAVSQVQGTLLLDAIGKQEQIKVDESEIDGRLAEIADLSNAPLEVVRQHYARDDAREGFIAQITEEKAMRFLIDKAKLTEVDKAELEAEKAE